MSSCACCGRGQQRPGAPVGARGINNVHGGRGELDTNGGGVAGDVLEKDVGHSRGGACGGRAGGRELSSGVRGPAQAATAGPQRGRAVGTATPAGRGTGVRRQPRARPQRHNMCQRTGVGALRGLRGDAVSRGEVVLNVHLDLRQGMQEGHLSTCRASGTAKLARPPAVQAAPAVPPPWSYPPRFRFSPYGSGTRCCVPLTPCRTRAPSRRC